MSKKILVIGLALALIISVSATCLAYIPDDMTMEGYPIVTNPITLKTIFPKEPLHGDFETMWFFGHELEKLGINLDFTPVDQSAFSDRASLELTSQNYSDIYVTGISTSQVATYSQDGTFIPLTELINDYAPHIKALLNDPQYVDIVKAICDIDGNIYYIPSISSYWRGMGEDFAYVNQTWLDNLGLDIPTTTEEFKEVLIAFRDQDANGDGDPSNEIPMLIGQNASIFGAFGFARTMWDIIDGEVVYVPEQDNYRALVEYMIDLYSEGLIEQSMFSESNAEIESKISTGMVGITFNVPYNSLPKPEDYSQYVAVPALTSPVNDTPTLASKGHSRGNSLIITDKCETPEVAMRVFDYWYTEEGTLDVRLGPQYGTWDGDGGYEPVYDENGNIETFILHNGNTTNYYNFRMSVAPMQIGSLITDYLNSIVVDTSPNNKWYSDVKRASNWVEATRDTYPTVVFTPEENDIISVYGTDLNNYMGIVYSKWVTGDEVLDDDSWNSYIETLHNTYNLDIVLGAYKSAFERYKELPATFDEAYERFCSK